MPKVNDSNKPALGALLRSCRESCRLTAREIPAILERYGVKISYSTYMGYESGNSMPNADVFLLLCDIYHVQDILATFGYRSPGTRSTLPPGLLRKLERLDDADQARVESYADGLLESEKYSFSQAPDSRSAV